MKAMRGGLDADDRDSREHIFGKNLIDIQQKSVPQLLVDEVSVPLTDFLSWSTHIQRRSIRSTYFKSLVSFSGHWMNTTTMPPAYFSFQFLASVLL